MTAKNIIITEKLELLCEGPKCDRETGRSKCWENGTGRRARRRANTDHQFVNSEVSANRSKTEVATRADADLVQEPRTPCPLFKLEGQKPHPGHVSGMPHSLILS